MLLSLRPVYLAGFSPFADVQKSAKSLDCTAMPERVTVEVPVPAVAGTHGVPWRGRRAAAGLPGLLPLLLTSSP